MHSKAISVSPRTLHGAWRDTQRGGGGTIQTPNRSCRGAARYTQLTSPCALQGRPDARVRTHRLYWDSGSAPRARRGWDRVTARELQVTRSVNSDVGGLCSLCPEGCGWPSSGALPPLPASLCLCSWGTEGLWGGQRGPGKDVRTPGPGVVPKIANQGNH